MKRKSEFRVSDERGMALLAVILIIFAAAVIGMAGVSLVGGDLRIAGNYRDDSLAFWASEAAAQQALETLRQNPEFTGTVNLASLSNQTTSSATISSFGPLTVRAVANGGKGVASRQIEEIINTDSAFSGALNVGGNLTLVGQPTITNQGIRLNGSANLNLDSGTPTLDLYAPSSSQVTVTGDTKAVNRIAKPAMDIGAVKVTLPEFKSLANQAAPAWSFGGAVFGDQSNSQTFSSLDFNSVTPAANGMRTIFVDGNVIVTDSISGTGTIVATGSITLTGGSADPSGSNGSNGNNGSNGSNGNGGGNMQGGCSGGNMGGGSSGNGGSNGNGGYGGSGGNNGADGMITSGATVSMIAQRDVLLNFDTNTQSKMNGLVYTEGNYELHGKVQFTGVVTAFGSVDVESPSQFTANSDPNYWYTYSSAYNVIADPAHVLSWAEDK
jgi:hypothetical protein